jgi:phosphomannomutase
MEEVREPEFLSCFKAYDVRGKLGTELNEDVAYRIGRSFAQHMNAKKVVVGGDIRLTSDSLKSALARGLMDSGCDVVDIGMVGTEEVYFASFFLDVDGGIEVTASHNPMDYNGMKFVGRDAVPISGDTGLKEIQTLAENNVFTEVTKTGTKVDLSILDNFVSHLIEYIDPKALKPMKIVVNAGNGAAGHVIDALEDKFSELSVKVEFIKIHHEADGEFPNGIPNPLIKDNQKATTAAVIEHQADMGIAWDGDFDRCFLFDETGGFIEGYYIVGLLAQTLLKSNPGSKIIHDPRLTWNTIDMVEEAGGIAIQSKTGHAFIKERMRKEDALYGGEMSAHHYFKDFYYCDSGMIPWLLIYELLSVSDKKLSELVKDAVAKYPCSGEINYKVADVAKVIAIVRQSFEAEALSIDETDGLGMTFANWRMNIRGSNTEPLIRLNIESRNDKALVEQKIAQLDDIINQE